MTTLHDVRWALSDRAREIEDAFARATTKPPWTELPEPERMNYLRNLIPALLEAALGADPDPRTCRRALHIAARHGERRRDQGLPEQVLFDDLYYFRSALCSQLEPDLEGEVFSEVVLRIDGLLSLATFAALRGYHRDAFEAKGQWPETVDEITARWTNATDPLGGRRVEEEVPGRRLSDLIERFLSEEDDALRRLRRRVDDLDAGARDVVVDALAELAASREFLGLAWAELDPVESERVEGGSPELVAIFGSRGALRYAGGSVAGVLGVRPETLVGTSLFALVHPVDLPELTRALEGLESGGGDSLRCRFRARHTSGSWRVLDASVHRLPLPEADATFVLRARPIGPGAAADDTATPEGSESPPVVGG